jgi:hypothetical protein
MENLKINDSRKEMGFSQFLKCPIKKRRMTDEI